MVFIKNILLTLSLLLTILIIGCKKKLTTNPIATAPIVAIETTFVNPLLNSGPDPWVYKKDSYYYYMHTLGNRIDIWKTTSMTDLKNAQIKTVWTLPATGSHSKNIWAPELHFLNDKWYLYYTAGATNDLSTQRLFVLENTSPDPLDGLWTDKGNIGDPAANVFSIDGTILTYKEKNYLIWSANPSASESKQNLYIARMSNPWTLETARSLLSSSQYDWEKIGGSQWVNEGPEILKNAEGDVFMVYSASGCWTDDYSIGMMTLKKDADPLLNTSWTKFPRPVFSKNPAGNTFGPGHNGFFKSPDGKENWIIYHANSNTNEGCKDKRNPRIQKFTWKSDGSPDFGTPLSINTPIKKPSGDQ